MIVKVNEMSVAGLGCPDWDPITFGISKMMKYKGEWWGKASNKQRETKIIH